MKRATKVIRVCPVTKAPRAIKGLKGFKDLVVKWGPVVDRV